MIILHYIPDMTSSPDGAAGFVTSLLQSTQQVATSHVVTRNDLGSNIVSFTRNFIKHVESINPDIVHVHACWDLRAAIIEKIARSKGYFTIVSPHGGLSPSVMEQEFWKKRLPRIILYQLRMTRKCKSAIVTSDKESRI